MNSIRIEEQNKSILLTLIWLKDFYLYVMFVDNNSRERILLVMKIWLIKQSNNELDDQFEILVVYKATLSS